MSIDPLAFLPKEASIENIPDEIFLDIFSWLEKTELGKCCRVSKKWQRIISDNALWIEVAKQKFGGKVPSAPNLKSFLQQYEAQMLKSNEEILDRFQAFANRISLGQNGRFRCIISTGSQYGCISVEIKGSQEELNHNTHLLSLCYHSPDFDLKDDCIALNGIGNGSLAGPQQPDYRPTSYSCQSGCCMQERVSITTIPARGPFQAVLRFPIHYNIAGVTHAFADSPELECGITNIIGIKLDALESQASRQNAVMYTTAGVAAALGAGLLYYLFTKTKSTG